MRIIIKGKPYITKTTLMDIYHAFVYPYIYFNIVWGSTYNKHLDRLVISQKKVDRILTGKVYSHSSGKLFKSLKIMKVKQINTYLVALHMYKHDKNSLSTYLDGMFQTNSTHDNTIL